MILKLPLKKWDYDIESCPLNKRVHFLIKYNGYLFEMIGTLTTNLYNGTVIKGECIEGSSKIFYEGDFIAWMSYISPNLIETLGE